MTITAIQTIYNGYKFRSRLEARWAVFFDTLGIPYEYEKEGFDIDGQWYLPDFWLPEQKIMLEIKPGVIRGLYAPEFEHPEHVVFVAVRETDNSVLPEMLHDFYVIVGEPWIDLKSAESTEGTCFYNCCNYWDRDHLWCECPQCHKIGITFEGRAERLCHCFDGDKGCNTVSPRLIKAYTAARQARFEHRKIP